jgi:hypothetical protein
MVDTGKTRLHSIGSRSALLTMLFLAALMAQGCREKVEPASAGSVQVVFPAFAARSERDDAASGFIERADGDRSRAAISWDVDPRSGPVTEAVARAVTGLQQAEAIRTQVAGHDALLLRAMSGATLVWRCDKSARLFRLSSEGPRSPDVARLATQVHCHADRSFSNGDVPALAMGSLGAPFQFANRGRGSISWMNQDEVMTLFAGQAVPAPRDADAARKAAPEWVAAAGLSGAHADAAELSQGPQGHPGVAVHGAASLDGHAVRWTLLFWRCLQRQKTFAAVIFGQRPPDEGPLRAARCHG